MKGRIADACAAIEPAGCCVAGQQRSPLPLPVLIACPCPRPPNPTTPRPLQGLAAGGKLASLTVAQLSKYVLLHGLPTGGKKAEIVARIAEHVKQQQ